MKKLNSDFKIKFKGFNESGMRRKLMDLTIQKKIGWRAKFTLDKSFIITYIDFLNKIKI